MFTAAINENGTLEMGEVFNLIETYDLAIYWPYVQNYIDGEIAVGSPINTEEDVNDLSEMRTKVLEPILNATNEIIGRNEKVVDLYYPATQPTWIIQPLEDYENPNNPYHNPEFLYVWLCHLNESSEDIQECLVSNGNRGIKSTQQEFFEDNSGLRFEDRLRLYAINTNGNHLDGSGGPELNFYRVGSDNWITGDITSFSDLIGFGLSTSVADSTNWISVRNIVNDIMDDHWGILKFRQILGCYEGDGGPHNQTISGIVIKADIDIFGLPIAGAQINIGPKIDKRDDQLHKRNYERQNSYISNVVNQTSMGWGLYQGWPIERASNNSDLKLCWSNL
ncbi:MAG: hypothetical protein R2753_08365 [Chitinophagales bacterium]